MTNLTDKWKKGELPEGWYYIKDEDRQIIIAEYYAELIDRETNETECVWSCLGEPEQVLGRVPSYELWKAVHEQWKVLLGENTKLKELLKECKLAIFDYPPYDLASDKIRLQIKINQVLGEE